MNEPASLSRARAFAALALLCLVAHGLLLIHDARLNDDWAYLSWIRTGDLATLADVHAYSANPIMAGYYAAFMGLGEPLIALRLVGFLSIVITAAATFELARELGGLPPRDALAVAALAMVTPAFRLHVSSTLSALTFFHAVFLTAAVLAVCAERARGWRHVVPRLAAFGLFFASFTLSSHLVYYGGFALLLVAWRRREAGRGWRDAVEHFVFRRADLLVLPVLFWGFRLAYIRGHVTDPTYNAITREPGLVLSALGAFGRELATVAALILSLPRFAACLALGLVAARAWRRDADEPPARPAREALGLAVGVGLLAFAIVPYVVVGKGPWRDGQDWGTRLLLLAGAPLGVLVLGAVRWLGALLRLSRRVGDGVLLALVLSSSVVQVENYLRWFARVAETRSIQRNLAAFPWAKEHGVFGVRASRLVPRDTYYAWAHLLREALGGGLERIIFIEPPQSVEWHRARVYAPEELEAMTSDWWSRRYGLRVKPGARQATLVIEPGERHDAGAGDAALALRYLRARFAGGAELDAFLRDLTRVGLIPKGR